MVKRLLLAVAIPCVMGFAQVPVAPIVQPHVTFVDASGNPCSACTLSTFVAGTTTPLATYTDSTGTSQNTNPIVLDASGGVDAAHGGQIWLSNATYKLVLKDKHANTIWTVDNVKGGGGIGGICGPAGAIQIANNSINALTCDATITVNTATHSINVGTLPSSHVTIGAMGSPTSWIFDTTSPDTARSSLGIGGLTVFGRALPVTAQNGDYPCSYITGAICSLPTFHYQTVQSNSTPQPQRGTLNLKSGPNITVGCVDNPGADSTDCSVSSAGFTGNLTNPGYQILPSGLIFEWATGTINNDNQQSFQTVPLPYACPTEILSASVSTNWYSGNSDDIMIYSINMSGGGPTTTGIPVVRSRRGDDSPVTTSPTVFVICH